MSAGAQTTSRTAIPGIYRIGSRTGQGATFQARVYVPSRRRCVTKTFPTLDAAESWQRDQRAELARHAARSASPRRRTAAEGYTHLRRAARALDDARAVSTGRARQALDDALAAIYRAEDGLGPALRA